MLKSLEHLKIPLEDIKQATNNFSQENLIGKTGFGMEYKGELSHFQGQGTVAIHRLDPTLGQGQREFITQVTMLSSYKHENFVSLLGYCDEGKEKIVVYKHEKHGSLDKYLGNTNLTWMERIRICVGVARGLNHLHHAVGPGHRVLHRDVKSKNILLDENWEPRITGFQLSKFGPANLDVTFVVTNACGTFGYVDPLYVRTGILTKESDTYSFGTVLFEVLCGRMAMQDQYHDERRFLGPLAKHHYEQQILDELIDPILRKQMDRSSLNTFSETAYQCLNDKRENRPRMGLVVKALEKALEFQWIYENGLQLQQVVIQLKEERKVQDDYYEIKGLDYLKVPLKEIKSATRDFDAKYTIGRGGFGTVYKAELFHFDIRNSGRGSMVEFSGYLRTRSTVAIKRLDPNSMQGRSEFLQEISLLSSYRHQNVVALVGFCDEGHENILVYEYAFNGSLDKCMQKTRSTLTWSQRLQICLDAACGLDYLHNGVGEHHRIIHRDVKSSNILLDQDWKAKISDFGLSRIGPANLHATFVMTEVAGTPDYVDPQYWKTGRLTKESDVYSFGVVLFEVLCGRLPSIPRPNKDPEFLSRLVKYYFKEKPIYEIIDPKLKKIFEKGSSVKYIGTSLESIEIFCTIINKCLEYNQQERPTMAEVVKELEKAMKCNVKTVDDLRISLDDINFATSNFSDENVIGKGAFGKVYKGELSHSKGHSTVAIKRLGYTRGSYGEREFFKEIAMLFSYNHENIIPLIGFCAEGGEKIIVYEHAFHGSLDKHLHNNSLTWRQRLNICIDAARGLDYIHSGVEPQHTVHGDIKSSNILIKHDWKATITDFIIAKGEGTFGYVDPLYTSTGILTKESDVFSFGVVLFEILCGRLAIVDEFKDERRNLQSFAAYCFEHKKLQEIIFHNIKEKTEASSLDTFSAIAYQCLRENREERPTMAQVVVELEKALKFQEEWEWEQKLPRDFARIIQMSKYRTSSTITKKKLYSLLSSGILLPKDNVWFSLSKDGATNEMISSKKFSYRNLRSLKWRSIRKSRFPKVAKMLDTSNLNIHIQIRTQFLSPGKVYGAYLVFKYCDQRRVSGGPIYVNLKYKTPNGTLNAYIAEQRDEEWMMIELNQFMNHNQTFDFEVLLKSFSCYSCGSGAIFIEGIAFQAIDNVDCKENVKGLVDVDSKIDEVQQLPSDIQEIIKRSQYDIPNLDEEELYMLLSKGILIDNGEKLFSLSKVNGKKCHMLPAKVVIYKSSHVKCSNCEPHEASRFTEVVELQSHQAFSIKCNIETQLLSPDRAYACYLVFELKENCMGLKCPVKARDLLNKYNKEATIIYFRSPSLVNLNRNKRIPKLREDGWMEVIVWGFNSHNERNDDYLPMDLKLVCLEGTMSGLIVCGIEFRPT